MSEFFPRICVVRFFLNLAVSKGYLGCSSKMDPTQIVRAGSQKLGLELGLLGRTSTFLVTSACHTGQTGSRSGVVLCVSARPTSVSTMTEYGCHIFNSNLLARLRTLNFLRVDLDFSPIYLTLEHGNPSPGRGLKPSPTTEMTSELIGNTIQETQWT